MNIIIYGAGKGLKRILEKEFFFNDEILAIVDRDIRKQGNDVSYHEKHIKIIDPIEMLSYKFDRAFISVVKFSEQVKIANQLVAMGIDLDRIMVFRDGEIAPGLAIGGSCQVFSQNDIFMDTSTIAIKDYNTGIQRVLKRLYNEMIQLRENVYPIRLIGGKCTTSHEFERRMKHSNFNGIEYPIIIPNRCWLILLDSSWNVDLFFDSIAHDVRICSFVYDLTPVVYPSICVSGTRYRFLPWIQEVLIRSEKIVCISMSVADDLINFFHKVGIRRTNPLEVYVSHLGFDIHESIGRVREEISFFVRRSSTFLAVGTVEPRKNYFLLIKAIKRMHDDLGISNVQLLILGKDGWMNQEFKDMYEKDSSLREYVLWIRDASDTEIQWAYTYCSALVYPSISEGFGLPLVEAAHFGLPILCSDIPVFHEIASDHAEYFKVNDENALIRAINQWLVQNTHPDSRNIKLYTWKECASEILDILDDKAKPYMVLHGNGEK